MSYINQYFRTALSPLSILAQAREKIKRGSTLKDTDFTNLESYLNSIFYPQEVQSKVPISRLQDATISTLEPQFQGAFDRYDFGSNIGNAIKTDPFKIGVGLYEREGHSSYIQSNTLRTRIDQIKEKLDTIKTEPEAESIRKTMESLITQMNEFLEKAGAPIDGTNIKISIKNNSVFSALLQQIDEKWQEITFYDSLPFPNWKAGQVFEQALTVSQKGIQYLEEATTEQLLEDFQKKTAGSSSANRGSLSLSTKISGVNIKEVLNKKGDRVTSYEITGKNGSSFSVKSVFDDKQGKMDVLYTMPEGTVNAGAIFKISAKNWRTIDSSRDFGSTSMLAALLRTTQEIDTVFSYAIQANYKEPILSRARNFGKVCAVVDIVMGYSQDNAYADTIVINDRAKRQIKVYSIDRILNKIQNNLNYNDYLIQKTEYHSNLNYSKHLNEQIHIIFGELQNYKLAISANILKL